MIPEELLRTLEKEMQALPLGASPKSLYEPIRYIMKLGGKRLRPQLALLSYGLYGKDPREILHIAVAIEAFHNFTLIHDDIMDQAPLRRGKPTVHMRWNTNTAILSGDVMLVKVYDLFLRLPSNQLHTALRLFNDCAAGVCEGQQFDMEFEARKTVSEKEYLSMIRLKTAVLLGFSLELGAVLANAPAEDAKRLRQIGEDLGIGFQLKDDLLDVYGDEKKFGKQVGGDILSNKKTFLLISALRKAKGSEKKKLLTALKWPSSAGKRKVKAVVEVYDKLQIKEATEKMIATYFDRAFSNIEQLSTKGKDQLKSFAIALAGRQR